VRLVVAQRHEEEAAQALDGLDHHLALHHRTCAGLDHHDRRARFRRAGGAHGHDDRTQAEPHGLLDHGRGVERHV
jgi:hypothetical protein